jgi:hypothetical protein
MLPIIVGAVALALSLLSFQQALVPQGFLAAFNIRFIPSLPFIWHWNQLSDARPDIHDPSPGNPLFDMVITSSSTTAFSWPTAVVADSLLGDDALLIPSAGSFTPWVGFLGETMAGDCTARAPILELPQPARVTFVKAVPNSTPPDASNPESVEDDMSPEFCGMLLQIIISTVALMVSTRHVKFYKASSWYYRLHPPLSPSLCRHAAPPSRTCPLLIHLRRKHGRPM